MLKPNTLGVWLPIELERLHLDEDRHWPEPGMMKVVSVELVAPNGSRYRVTCPDTPKALRQIHDAVRSRGVPPAPTEKRADAKP